MQPRPTALRLSLLSLVLILSAAACDFTASPQEAENPVGTEHTVMAEVDHEPGVPWTATFEIIDGPNAGLISTADGTCTGCAGTGDGTAQWTYQSNGVAGTDVIEVCVADIFGELCTGEEEFPEHVTKDWVVPTATPTNTPTRVPTQVVSGAAPDLTPPPPTWTPSPTPTRTATAVATLDPRLGQVAAIQPPSTGDGGVSGGGPSGFALLAIATAVIGICTASLALRRSKDR